MSPKENRRSRPPSREDRRTQPKQVRNDRTQRELRSVEPPRGISRERSFRDEGPVRVEKTRPSVVFGVLPVLEALRADNRRVEKVLIADGVREHRLAEVTDICRQRSIPWNRVPRESFALYVDQRVNHQGVIAVISSAAYVEADGILDASVDPALLLILDGIEDPRNLGAILRVGECSGVDGVIIPERRAVGLTDTVAKSSAGAIEYVKVAKVANLNRLIEELKRRNIWVVGTSSDAAQTYTEWDWTRPSALVLGSEGSGLHRLVAENCDALVRIPMQGKIESLNVSVAAGVILFEAQRQRRKKP